MANLITLSRLLLLAVIFVLGYSTDPYLHWTGSALIPVMFATDALDGYIARRRDEESVFGARFDVFSDRVVEITLWGLFVVKGVAPLWALLLVGARGLVTDALRRRAMKKDGGAPLDTVRSRWGHWVVASPAMRFSYALLKGVTFFWLMICLALANTPPGDGFTMLGNVLVVSTVSICLLRGLPVVIESVGTAGTTPTRSRLHSFRR